MQKGSNKLKTRDKKRNAKHKDEKQTKAQRRETKKRSNINEKQKIEMPKK